MICVAASVIYLDSTIIPVAIPTIRADLGASSAATQWLLNAYTLALAALLLSIGSLGDKLGRKIVLLTGIAGFTVSSAMCALAPNAPVLIAARAGQGVFAASVLPLSLAVTSALFTNARQKSYAIAIWGGSAGAATALGPLVGGLLVQVAGWRSIFWINVPICVAGLIGLAWSLPPSASRKGTRLDIVGVLLFILGNGALTFAMIEGGTYGWVSTKTVTLVGIGAAAVLVFVRWEARCGAPMLPPRLLRVPVVAAACTMNFLGLFGVYAVMFLLTMYLQKSQHQSPLDTGLHFLAFTATLSLVTVFAPMVVDRWGIRRTAVTGLIFVAAGFIGLIALEYECSYLSYAWALVLLGFGVPLSSGVVAIQAMMSEVPAELSGTASGMMNTFRHLGAAFGVALAGILSPERDGIASSMYLTFIVAAAGALAAAAATGVLLRPKRTAHSD